MPAVATSPPSAPGAEPAIVVEGLARSFAGVPAVDGLSFVVHPGEIFGFLGHNGAGKTTTVRLLNGVLRADAGKVRVLGYHPDREGDALRARTGVLTEAPAFDERFTARENLRFTAGMFSLPEAVARARVEELLSTFELAAQGDQRVATFSKGMKQKLAIVRALLHRPAVVYLDEPTSGLDPLASRQLYTLMRQLRAEGCAVFFTTHRLFEASELCDRVAIVSKGRIVAEGTPVELARRVGGQLPLEIEVAPADVDTAAGSLAATGRPVQRTANAVVVDAVAREEVPHMVAAVAASGARVYGVRLREPTLEDAYVALQRAAP